ncbi:capsule assembly Wzi family protein [Enterobacillus tribolii]|uniref:Capsule assembly protein Wzi n=1 Tax=Enterobacillus tribolii TaxID=1487935 RepID=A0A370QNB8_9GAMM|nr:capsule assembly Wzi family protein [Enterobacillus tribolii]MBW7982122.1 capsule assembly Wzi family protein [Enterobacillus tribolii]RDK89856.1 capsule assembly protein Wzi [Enterobacillus tribolii]
MPESILNKISLTGAIPLFFSFTVSAAGLIAPDNDLRNDLAWLSDRGVISVSLSTWPLSQEEIERVVSQAKQSTRSDQIVLDRVQRRLKEIKSDIRISAYTSTDRPGLPRDFANTPSSGHGLGLAIGDSGEFWDVNVQGRVEGDQYIDDESRWNLDGSYGALKIFNQWVSFGSIPQWWGPGYDGSLIRSDAARPVIGFMMQRADQSPFETPWLSWIGPWQYQLSAGQLEQYSSVPDTKLIGGRFTMMPTSFLELGASRMMMWGGDGRPQSWHSFWDAATGSDNTGDARNDPGNQLGGFDFRLKLQPLLNLPLSVYGQIVGEDEAGMLPSKNTYLVGLEGHHAWDMHQINWHIEGADTRSEFDKENIIYTHFIYKGGYYQQGYPLGHAMGGDGQALSGKVELVLEDGQRWSTRLMYAKVNPQSQSINHAFPYADTLKGIELGWGYDFESRVRFNTYLWYTDSKHGTFDDVGASLGLEIPISL